LRIRFTPDLIYRISSVGFAAPTAPVPLSLVQRALPTWIKGEVDDPQFFTKEDKDAFANALSGVVLDTKLSVDGSHNDGIWTLSGTYTVGSKIKSLLKSRPKYDGETLMLKVLKAVDNAAIGEVKALRLAGRLVDSGMLRDSKWSSSKPVIIMKKVLGQPLYQNEIYLRSRKQEALEEQTFKMICQKLATIALTTGVLPSDMKPSNVHVTLIEAGNSLASVDLVDFGPPATYLLRNPKPTENELLTFCGSSPELSGKFAVWKNDLYQLTPASAPKKKART